MLVMIKDSMRNRISAKLDSHSNATAFKLRMLFKRHDHENEGIVTLAGFREMLESFGIQLSEDEAIVVFAQYDKFFRGKILYAQLMQDLLADNDYYNMWKAGVNL